MQENKTFDEILERLLEGARENFPELDTREGSLIHTALAPAAVEISKLHTALNFALEMSYADTASRDYLIRRAAERGLAPFAASHATVEAAIDPPELKIPAGTRFRSGSVMFVASGQGVEGRQELTAEVAGTSGNIAGGRLIPVDFVEGLREAGITALTVPGRSEEATETFRQRYMESHRAQSFGGNIAAYREKVLEAKGVGGVRVSPANNGPGTVGIRILAADYGVPSTVLLAELQELLDPRDERGKGKGWAPIGHRVTVEGVKVFPIAVATNLTTQIGADTEAVKQEAERVIRAYFLEQSAAWGEGEPLVIRISQVDTRLLDVQGVLDVAETTLNNERGNVLLDEEQIPVLEELVVLEGLAVWNA